MANIANLDLDIKKGRSRTTVIVTYEICFTNCEIKAGVYFYDRADMYGADQGADDFLFNVGATSCFKATKKCIKRKYKRNVNNSLLNEDNGLFNRRDEVYAKACVSQFVASGDCANSTLHYDRF